MKLIRNVPKRVYERFMAALTGGLGLVMELSIAISGWRETSSSSFNNPAFFPDLVAKALILVFVVLLAASFGVSKEETVRFNLGGIAMLVIWYIFALALQYTGLILGGMAAIAISLLLWGERRPKTIALVSIITPIVIYFALGVLMNVSFPKGVFGF